MRKTKDVKKRLKNQMEQRSVIYYLTRKNTKTKDIKAELDQVYKEQALSISQVYYWMFILGREDLNNESSPGRTPDEGIDSSILLVLEKDPRATAHNIAHKLGLAVSTVTFHLTQNLGSIGAIFIVYRTL